MVNRETLDGRIARATAFLSETLTYASSTTVTAPTGYDITMFLEAGDIIMFTQSSTVKQFSVQSIATSGSGSSLVCTLTLNGFRDGGGTKYTVANSPITDAYVTPSVKLFGQSNNTIGSVVNRASAANQTIGSGADVKVAFDAIGRDQSGNYDTSTNKFTCSVPGIYLVVFQWCFTDTAGANVKGLIYVDGGATYEANRALANNETNNFVRPVALNATQTIEFYVRQNSGGNKTLSGGAGDSFGTVMLMQRK